MNPRGTLERMRDLVRIDPLTTAVVLAVVIAVLGVAGALEVRYEAAPAFDLDAELKVPALVAGLILLGAALAAYVAASWRTAGVRLPWVALAGLFAFMAADETLAIHETLEDVTGVDWQTLYLPVILVGGSAWVAALTRLRHHHRVAALLLLAGGAMWAVAAALEAIQWTGPMEAERAVDGYGILMGIEELLEMCGSSCFLLGSLVAARRQAGIAQPARSLVESEARS